MSGIEKQAGGGRDDPIRTFICIEIPETVKERIADLQRELKQIDAQVSWVKPANIHLTLKFLGPVAPSRMAGVRHAVERAAGSCSPFEVEVSRTGCFPSPRNPKVLWVGLSNIPNQLQQLHQAMEDELARAGFARETKRFSPHLTIARVRSPRGAPAVAERLIASTFPGQTFSATEVIVMRSDLNPSGSVYTPQALIQLGQRP
ncbi:MAG TPA: RNA 2',3'-cyclic phosphodiesterase [Blastocatellia bacterium]|nr:RNA 2',3'-cyclic phosphodiesterase [Blastocatellia bacterium]